MRFLCVLFCVYLGVSWDNNINDWYDKWLKGDEIRYINTDELRDKYDFIVVGAGVGGSVVAHRLAMSDSNPKVLLLEAGKALNTSGLSSHMIPLLVATNQFTYEYWITFNGS